MSFPQRKLRRATTSAPIPVPLQSECVKERPNRKNCGRHGTAKTASSRMVFAEMDNAMPHHSDINKDESGHMYGRPKERAENETRLPPRAV